MPRKHVEGGARSWLGAAADGPGGAISSQGVDNNPGAAVAHHNSLNADTGLITLKFGRLANVEMHL